MRLDRQSLKLCHCWLAEQDPGSQYERDALLTIVQGLLALQPGEEVTVGVYDDETERTERLFELLDLIDDPAEHEVDCECSRCTDLWRPEDAAPAILDAERWAAEHEKTCSGCGRRKGTTLGCIYCHGAMREPDPVRAAAADDPRGEADR
jgi:hypothetical protein